MGMDVFTWSMPFVIEKVTEMLFYILQPTADAEAQEEIKDEDLPPVPTNMDANARASLSIEQKEAVELATRLGVLVANNGGEAASLTGETAEVRDRMRKKVRTIARMARMFKTLRQENETVLRLKGVCPGDKLSPGLLLAGKEKMTTELEMFGHASDVDSQNEMRPDLVVQDDGPVPTPKRAAPQEEDDSKADGEK